MARNGKRAPTPPRAGDTLDTIATFVVERDLYEGERKEIYTAVRDRLADLKNMRKKTCDLLGIPVEQETEITRVIALYEGDTGILALFQTDAEALEEEKKGGKDYRQRELPLDVDSDKLRQMQDEDATQARSMAVAQDTKGNQITVDADLDTPAARAALEKARRQFAEAGLPDRPADVAAPVLTPKPVDTWSEDWGKEPLRAPTGEPVTPIIDRDSK